jgi:protein TonB
LAESFFLHGLLAGMLILTAGAITIPPKIIHLDVSLIRQVATPLHQAPPVHKAVITDEHPLAQPQPVPLSRPKVVPIHQKKIIKFKVNAKAAQPKTAPVAKQVQPPLQTITSPPETSPGQKKTLAKAQSSPGPRGRERSFYNTSKLRSYLGLIRSRIEQEKRYPLWARSHRLEGKVNIRFILSTNGKVSAVQVSKSSGQDCLDEAAVQAVQQASPMPPPPEGILSKATSMELTIVFRLT